MNVICLVARITNSLELKQTPNGKSVCNFSVAAERKFKGADDKPIVDFIDCVAWGSQADFLCKWFDKGVRVALTGELQTRTYTDKDSNNRKVYEVLVNTVEFADGKRESNTSVAVTQPVNNTNDFAANTSDDWVPVEDADLPF